MEIKPPSDNSAALESELAWLRAVIDTAIRLYFGQECEYRDVRDVAPPGATGRSGTYAQIPDGPDMSFDERLVLILALAPHVRPQILDPFLNKNANFDRGYTEFGGVTVGTHGGFWPTAETAAFILAGDSLERRFAVQRLFGADHFFRRTKLLQIDEGDGPHSLFSAPLSLGREYLNRLTTGADYRPVFGSRFPARRLTTPQEWDDLVLPRQTRNEIEEIRAWIHHHRTLFDEWGLARKINPGFRSLFYGPPGTGKTMTAALLGKVTGLDVYRVDLSMVVSKWVGETEKNLAGVFEQAETNDWILFFDEADALFGKRTQTSSAHDRYANQEVSYLLQRVEDFPGVVILASNLRGNIDDAFARRFQSMIYFPMPGVEERRRLWQGAFSDPARLAANVDLDALAEEFEVTGGAIVNVLRHAALMAVKGAASRVTLDDIRDGIRREFRKEGKVVG